MGFQDYVGSASAATLGYILGGTRGAKSGFRAFNSFQKSMKRKAISPATFYGKAKRMKTVSKRSIGTQTENKKTVRRIRWSKTKGCKKLSKCLKKQIRNIALRTVHKEKPLGRYDRFFLFNFPTDIGTPSDPKQVVVNQLLFGSSGGYTDANMAVGTYNRVIDSVSVLFGGKAAAFYSGTGNLNPAGTIIPDFNHLCVYQITNNTPVTQCFLIYETTPKDDRTSNVYDAWLACNNTQVGGTTRAITYLGNRPEKYSQFRDSYRILKKKLVKLGPGKRMQYVLRTGAKHLKLDEWLGIGSLTPTQYRKNFTKELLIINWNDPVYGTADAAATYMGGAWLVPGANQLGIGVEVKEYFRMRCPENIDQTTNDDNVFCIFSQYAQGIVANSQNTIVAPAISQPGIQQ